LPKKAETLVKKERKSSEKTTPMIQQWFSIKEEHKTALLFFRMGDFYELFFEDAKIAARALDISLTKRGKHKGEDIPMCGVPMKAHEAYLSRLIRQGHKVAVCEQMEDPAEAKKRGYKAIVKRDVVRLVTSGTLTEDNLLDSRQHNYLVCLNELRSEYSISWVDISTGEFEVQAFDDKDEKVNLISLSAAFARLNPSEIIFSEKVYENEKLYEILSDYKKALSPLPAAKFNSDSARIQLEEKFGVKALDAFGDFTRCDIGAAGSLLDYINLTQKGATPRLSSPQKVNNQAIMEIDAATRKNLELTRTVSGERDGKSLLRVIDRTVTSLGGRLLSSYISSPLTNPKKINERLDIIEFFTNEIGTKDDIRERLKNCPDIERALSRIAIKRCGPRDLATIKTALSQIPLIISDIKGNDAKQVLNNRPEALEICISHLGNHDEIVNELENALADELPLHAKDGGFIKQEYNEDLDRLKSLRDESRNLIISLQSKYCEETGVNSLKVKHNNVIGYFIEVTAKHGETLLTDKESKFIHRQTMANAMRFTTVELTELEKELAGAAEKAQSLEEEIFKNLCDKILSSSDKISVSAKAMAQIDVATSLADLSVDRNYCRPVVDESLAFEIKGGRHPVVEASIELSKEGSFVSNDCILGGKGKSKDGKNGRLWLITGPNMAGKSTFLRQNALIAIMAQMGSFVPAQSAKIGVVNRLFSRVGASDDLARGRSTFMVEMVETAAILNQSDKRALVILDEIGRGTATFDGLSIAWAVVENLHEVNKCRALFATHYHELTALASKLSKLCLKTIKVKEWNDEIIFLHKVISGTADRSYGIHVAKIAGLPKPVIARAEEVLDMLENSNEHRPATQIINDLPLFQAVLDKVEEEENNQPTAQSSKVLDEVKEINPDELTPKQALDILYKLKQLEKEET
jgi:DNA mismatch repair protein MutS